MTNGLKLSPLGGEKAPEDIPIKSVLVLGGSSCVGAATIQLVRLALPHITLLATSSRKHHDHLIALGATKCFERSSQDDTSVLRAAIPQGNGVDAIIDCVAAAASHPDVFSALDSSGPRIYAQIVTGDTVNVPGDINASLAFGKDAMDGPDGSSLLIRLSQLLEDGRYKVPIEVEVVGKGYEKIAQGLDQLLKGVSGLKYAVTL